MHTEGPALVMIGGVVKLARKAAGLHRLNVKGRGEALVAANIPRL